MGSNERIEVDWVPFKRYIELFKETEDAVRHRMKSGAWEKGVHYNVPKGAGVWISLRAINAWAAGQAAQATA
jgi:hypothetical protein